MNNKSLLNNNYCLTENIDFDDFSKPVPLIYNNNINTSNIQNIMLIDETVTDAKLFYDSANSNTFPIIYSYRSEKIELSNLLFNKFQQEIKRIVFIFHDPSILQKEFLDNECFFSDSDLKTDQTEFSDNMRFLINLINKLNIKHCDFLACNTLKYNIWQRYYELLQIFTNVKCGASNDATGNIHYEANWIMENTKEDIKPIYFNDNIINYSKTLAATTITSNGGILYFQFINGIGFQYSFDYITWINIGTNYPINIQNTNPINILDVRFNTDLVINDSNAYFVCLSPLINFDGSRYDVSKTIVTILNIVNYPGLIRNGTFATNGFHTITVQNIQTSSTFITALINSGGWICQSYFGNNIKNIIGFDAIKNAININNCINNCGILSYSGGICGVAAARNGIINITNCVNNGIISGAYAGGICGQSAAFNNGTITISDCSNTGTIAGSGSGGLVGQSAGISLGTVNITNCFNSGQISGTNTGGICGQSAGETNGKITISDCVNTGLISGSFSGGICGYQLGYNSNEFCLIMNSYSISNISGSNAGGICGGGIGLNNSLNFISKINILKCYTLGNIARTCGGILGGNIGPAYVSIPIIYLTNCYSNGIVTDPASGLISRNLSIRIKIIVINCYIGNGNWTDISANAVLRGTPTNINTNNPASNWTSVSTNTPYVLSSFNKTLYMPEIVAINTDNYTTNKGTIQPNYIYSIINSNNSSITSVTINPQNGILTFDNIPQSPLPIITNVIASKYDSQNKLYNYNINSFKISNSICFKENSKILCLIDNEEIYVKVQDLRPNMLVKTYMEGYVPIDTVGWFEFVNDITNKKSNKRNPDGLYELTKEYYPELIDNLIMTGRHSILVDNINQEDLYKTYKKRLIRLHDKYKVSCISNKNANPYNETGVFKIWCFCLASEDNTKNFGIYANGLLVESTNKQDALFIELNYIE
jgi:hypothetical protein